MQTARTVATVVLAGFLWSESAGALPNPGERFPSINAQDLTGQSHSTDELVSRRTLLIAISDRSASKAMRAWYSMADSRVPASVARESLISLHLPFFVSIDTARSKARREVPQQYWHATLLDRGDIAAQLGLDQKVPYVFALDEHGRVLAAVHGPVDSPAAENVWRALAP
jgi:hypothetical protein